MKFSAKFKALSFVASTDSRKRRLTSTLKLDEMGSSALCGLLCTFRKSSHLFKVESRSRACFTVLGIVTLPADIRPLRMCTKPGYTFKSVTSPPKSVDHLNEPNGRRSSVEMWLNMGEMWLRPRLAGWYSAPSPTTGILSPVVCRTAQPRSSWIEAPSGKGTKSSKAKQLDVALHSEAEEVHKVDVGLNEGLNYQFTSYSASIGRIEELIGVR